MSTVASTTVTSRLSSKVTLRDSRTRHFGVGLPRRRAGRYTATRAEVTNGNGAPAFPIWLLLDERDDVVPVGSFPSFSYPVHVSILQGYRQEPKQGKTAFHS